MLGKLQVYGAEDCGASASGDRAVVTDARDVGASEGGDGRTAGFSQFLGRSRS